MYPGADIPSTQLSLLRGLDPLAHLRLGAALRELVRKNVLVVGSGFSFHNMGAFSWQGGYTPDPENDEFQDWLVETCTGSLPRSRMIRWEDGPSARYCHPREEHLMPLHVRQVEREMARLTENERELLSKLCIKLGRE